jgi:NAD(P)-dependent dehydrogenase (short-subunit alcohol dehydrogenase family)
MTDPDFTPPVRRGGLGAVRDRIVGAVMDPTVAGSFGRGGFRRHARGFVPGDLDVDLTGRVALVTGGHSGIGRAAAAALACRGAEVRLLGRNPARVEAAVEALRQDTGNPNVRAELLDVSDLDAIRDLASRLDRPRIDILVHNAGILPDVRRESPQGHETTLATHVLGPFLLTRLMLPRLQAAPDGRVIWVSSGGMYSRRLSLADPEWRTRPYDGVVAYAETKRMQVVLSRLWAGRLRGTTVTSNAMHPGWVDTGAVKTSLPRFHRVMGPYLREAAEGADTIVWLAAAHRIRGVAGRFWFDREARREYWLPGTRETFEEAEALWSFCERATESA